MFFGFKLQTPFGSHLRTSAGTSSSAPRRHDATLPVRDMRDAPRSLRSTARIVWFWFNQLTPRYLFSKLHTSKHSNHFTNSFPISFGDFA